MVSLHESLGPVGTAMGGGQGLTHFAWVLPGLAIGLAMGAFVGWCAWRIGGVAGRLMGLGIGLLLLGALGFEMATGYCVSSGGSNVTCALVYHVEEGVEALAAVVMLTAAPADLEGDGRLAARWIGSPSR